MLTALLPAIVMILGLLLWAWAEKTPPKDIGRYLFIIGAFFVVWALKDYSMTLLPESHRR